MKSEKQVVRLDRWVSERAVRKLIKFDGNCCMSCHDDEDYGISSMHEVELGRLRVASLCCTVAFAFEKYLKEKNGNKTK